MIDITIVLALLCDLAASAAATAASEAQPQSAPTRAQQLLAQARQVLDQQDTYALVELLDGPDPLLAARVYESLQLELYWKAKDLPKTIAVSRAGIQHGLGKSKAAGPEAGADLRSHAKALAYNLASFTWPGWDEQGIAPGATDLAAGFDAARLNLRLALELNKPAKAVSDAHWMLGAHHLAAGRFTDAAAAFDRARGAAADAKDPLQQQMIDGYSAMARLLERPDDADARSKFDAAVRALTAGASEDAKLYADQLNTALSVFTKKTPR